MGNVLPPFTADGVLPVGDYPLTLAELRQSFLVTGEGVPSDNWDTVWRGRLVENLALLAAQLWAVGIAEVFIDGSFVENRDHPGDIDGYFVADLMALATGRLEDALNHAAQDTFWTWAGTRRWVGSGSPKPQLPMWHAYRVELFPYVPGYPSGITDQFGNALEFPAAFRVSRQFTPKGIIVLKQGA